MKLFDALFSIGSFLLTALCLPALIELTGIVAFSTWPSNKKTLPDAPNTRYALLTVVIPAHNEAATLGATLDNILDAVNFAQAQTGLSHRIAVIADNCTDETHAIALSKGVDSFMRFDEQKRGKGYALEFAFEQLRNDRASGYLILDADARVDLPFIVYASKAFGLGWDSFQSTYRVSNAAQTPRTQWMQLALTGFNHLRLVARERLGLSVGILGNGFGLSKATVARIPYCAHSVVEDLEYHAMLVRSGVRVRHLPSVEVRSEMPVQSEVAAGQRARWEGGRFRLIATSAPKLLIEGLLGKPRLLEPAFELLLLPLTYQILFFCVLLAWPSTATRIAGGLGLALFAAHLLTCAAYSKIPHVGKTLIRLPIYVGWKLLQLPAILAKSKGNASWQRTQRIAEMQGSPEYSHDLSIVLVSFNTRHLLQECFESIQRNTGSLKIQTIVVDNASSDDSVSFIRTHWPQIDLIESSVNLGFGPANNKGFERCTGRYTVLLNTDAFLGDGVLEKAFNTMNQHPDIGVLGAKLVGRDGVLQPSARMFPGLSDEIFTLTGLSWKYRNTPVLKRWAARLDRTWADPEVPAQVDWVPGAFSVIPTHLLKSLNGFDTRFFLYYEEVDLCKRIKQKGYRVQYEPALVVVHIGGESSKSVKSLAFSGSARQLSLWRMRSQMMYYRKHHGKTLAWSVMQAEKNLHEMRIVKNRRDPSAAAQQKTEESKTVISLLKRAWQETQGGLESPPQPW